MRLYEIDEQIEDILTRVEDDSEDEYDLLEELSRLHYERTDKIDNVISYWKYLDSDSQAIENEINHLKRRLDKKQNTADRLKLFIQNATNGERFETARNLVTYRKSEAVVVADSDKVPPDYKEFKTVTSIDKTAIKKAIKSGVDVAGAYIEKRQNIQIK